MFDFSIATHLFYFIKDWKRACDEIIRITKGPILLFHTGMGKENAEINKKYMEYCIDEGVLFPKIGVDSTKEVVMYLESKGYQNTVKKEWSWDKQIDNYEAIKFISERSFSFSIWAKDVIHNKVISKLYNEFNNFSVVTDRIYLLVLEPYNS